MAFCSNCGNKLMDGAKFCQKCGCSVRGEAVDSDGKRQQEYVGKLYKCPNCGEVLKSFEAKCPTCGLELRGTKATSSVREFALKLEAIEARREPEKVSGMLAQAAAKQEISRTDAQKISLIQSFAVPNTKEDILEFMILATASISTSSFGTTDENKSEKAIADAWLSKVKQTYAKARSSYGNDADFTQIENLYNNCIQDVDKQKRKRTLKFVLMFGWIPLILIVMIGWLSISEPKEEAKEIERLENIVIEVQEALENGEYRHALRIADSIDYQRYEVEMERKWDIQRVYWVEKVLETASENGVDLDYTPGPDIDKANDEPEDETSSGGFVEGFKQSVQSGLDDAKENIDEFNEIMSKTSDEPENSNTLDAVDYSANVIEKGATYTFGHDEFDLYFATAISNEIIKIEKWGKHLSTAKSFSSEYEVGTYKITDPANGFTWLDDEHTAFYFVLQDKSNSDYKKSQEIVFTISEIDGDTNKGTNYSEDAVCFSYTNDDWHLYKAIPLSDAVIKIECWYRSIAIGSFNYGYDICAVDTESNETDFEWTDNEHTSFTITLKDENNGELKNGTFVTFTLE